MKKGDAIMLLFTLNIIGISWYSIITKNPMDTSIAVCYSTAIAAFVGRKGVVDYAKSKVTKVMEAGDV